MRKFVLLILLACTSVARAESNEARDIRLKTATLFGQGAFAQLNALEQKYWDGSKTADGVTKLSIFYAIFDQMMWDPPPQGEVPAFFGYVEKWVAKAPSPAATIVLAKLHLRFAWEQRGATGTVSPEGQKLFDKHVRISRTLLEAAKATASADPEWGATLAAVRRAEKPRSAISNHLVIAKEDPGLLEELNAQVSVQAKARLLFERRSYKGLNQLEQELRVRNEKTPAGQEQLSQFYAGIVQHAEYQTPSLTTKPNQNRWVAIIAQAEEWAEKAPSPAAYISVARLRMAYAWAWRGNDFAVETPARRMEIFRQNMKIAQDYLLTHKNQAFNDPEWHVAMMFVRRGGHLGEKAASAAMSEAIAKYPYYFPIYAAIATNLLPKWYGNWEAVEQFARIAAANTQEKMGMSFYARVYLKVLCDCDEMAGNKMDWKMMKQGLEDIQTRHPVQWNLNRYGFAACLAEDRATARAILPRITAFIPAAWDESPDLYKSCKSWATAKP